MRRAGRAGGPSTWVFGYGSLASAGSMARTIGRPVPGHDRMVGDLRGFGRRWNYGSVHLRGDWVLDDGHVRGGVVVSLGLLAVDTESCNGVAIRVTDDELIALDRRERDYDRVDVTDRVVLERADVRGPVVTYVPRASAVERYEAARDAGRAAIRRTYWDLVHATFDALGCEHLAQLARTPAPDVPIADIVITSGHADNALVSTHAPPPPRS